MRKRGGEIIVNDGKAKPAVLCWHSLSASGSRQELGDKRNLVLELGMTLLTLTHAYDLCVFAVGAERNSHNCLL